MSHDADANDEGQIKYWSAVVGVNLNGNTDPPKPQIVVPSIGSNPYPNQPVGVGRAYGAVILGGNH